MKSNVVGEVLMRLLFSGEMIISNDKYLMSEESNSYYSNNMRLVIRSFQRADLGGYKCISKNSIGDAEGNIRLYGVFWYLNYILIIKIYIRCFEKEVNICYLKNSILESKRYRFMSGRVHRQREWATHPLCLHTRLPMVPPTLSVSKQECQMG